MSDMPGCCVSPCLAGLWRYTAFQLALGGLAGYALVRFLLQKEESLSSNPRYSESVPRTSRRAGSKRCISRKGGKCSWPVGDQYHQRIALAYVQAGRCSEDEKPTCEDVINWIAKHGSGEAKQVAQAERAQMLKSARRARGRRTRTRARRL